MGDEIGRTQQGNNNAYCQDGPLSWVDWDLDVDGRELLEFARKIFALRWESPVLRRRGFFTGRPVGGAGPKDLSWLRSDGSELSVDDWENPELRVLGMLLLGEATDEVDEQGRPTEGDSLLLLLNGGDRPSYFQLPAMSDPGRWHKDIDTARPAGDGWRRSSSASVRVDTSSTSRASCATMAPSHTCACRCSGTSGKHGGCT